LKDEPPRRFQRSNDVVFKVVNGQPFRHGPVFIRKPVSCCDAKSVMERA
jgi:hypothetical protein